MKRAPTEIPLLDDDGLDTPEVGDWAEDKYRLVHLYGQLFTKSMQGKWERLVYIDLFAGAGRARIRNSSRILPASPTLALGLEPGFDLHVFCEQDSNLIKVLERRVRRDYGAKEVLFIRGDVNDRVHALVDSARSPHTLKFCFVDPYSLQNLHFRTIEILATAAAPIDFLVLIPTGYDATRNQWLYSDPESLNPIVDRFLGDSHWREKWAKEMPSGTAFERFITDSFGAALQRLGYIYRFQDTELIRLTANKAPLYRLAFFSRHKLGTKFWRNVKRYAPDQRSLF